VFVSALRGIGLDALRARLLGVIEADYVERTAILPVTEPKSRAYLHRVAEVLREETVMARAYDEEPEPALRLRFRTSKKNAPELDRMLARFAHLEAVPGGDGALGPEPGRPA
jgi:GTPase